MFANYMIIDIEKPQVSSAIKIDNLQGYNKIT